MSELSLTLSENNVGCYVKTDLKNINDSQVREIKKLLDKYGVLFLKSKI